MTIFFHFLFKYMCVWNANLLCFSSVNNKSAYIIVKHFIRMQNMTSHNGQIDYEKFYTVQSALKLSVAVASRFIITLF